MLLQHCFFSNFPPLIILKIISLVFCFIKHFTRTPKSNSYINIFWSYSKCLLVLFLFFWNFLAMLDTRGRMPWKPPCTGKESTCTTKHGNDASTSVQCFCWPPNTSSPCCRKARWGSWSLSSLESESANHPARALPLSKQLVPARCYLSGFLWRKMSGEQIASAFGACCGSSTVSPSLEPSTSRSHPCCSHLLTSLAQQSPTPPSTDLPGGPALPQHLRASPALHRQHDKFPLTILM